MFASDVIIEGICWLLLAAVCRRDLPVIEVLLCETNWKCVFFLLLVMEFSARNLIIIRMTTCATSSKLADILSICAY